MTVLRKKSLEILLLSNFIHWLDGDDGKLQKLLILRNLIKLNIYHYINRVNQLLMLIICIKKTAHHKLIYNLHSIKMDSIWSHKSAHLFALKDSGERITVLESLQLMPLT